MPTGAGNVSSGAAISRVSGTLWKQGRWPSEDNGSPCGAWQCQYPCTPEAGGSNLVKRGVVEGCLKAMT